ncbi:MAG: SBBP repeat-containing protein [Patescibacteria group bacterium]
MSDPNSNEIWTRQFGTSGTDQAYSVAIDASGNIYIVGWTSGAFSGQTSSGLNDAFIRAYDSDGNEIWTRQFGDSVNDYARDVAIDANGNIYVTGQTFSTLPGQTSSGLGDVFIRTYGSNGNEIWTRQFGTSGNDNPNGIAIDTNGNIYVAGVTADTLPGQTSSGLNDAFIRAYDSNGNEIWTRQFGTSGTDQVSDVTIDANGNIYVTGQTTDTLPGQTSSGGSDAFIRAYDSNGNEIWTRQFGTSDNDDPQGVLIDLNGNIYVVGGTYGTFAGQTNFGLADAFIQVYDPNSNEIWTRQFGTSVNDYAYGVATDASDSVYVAGRTAGTLPGQTSSGSTDAFLIKFSIQIDTDSDGIEDGADNCPADINTDQADADSDGQGDLCDFTPNGDTDGDGVDNIADNCSGIANAGQEDNDNDGLGNVCDPTPNGDPNPNPTSTDQCKQLDWIDFGFRNQGQCVAFINTGHDSR